MKKLTFLFAMIYLTLMNLNAQDIIFTFNSKDASNTIDSIKATIISTGETAFVEGKNSINLSSFSTGTKLTPSSFEEFIVYPNPFKNQTQLQFYSSKKDKIKVSLINSAGQIVAEKSQDIIQGVHKFNLSVQTEGLYILNVSGNQSRYSQKIISIKNSQSTNKIENNGYFSELKNEKSANLEAGELIHFFIYSGSNITKIADFLSESKTYEVVFHECKDADGKSYPIVQIGNQWWMAENLAYLPKVSSLFDVSPTDPKYYVLGVYESTLSEAKALSNYSKYGVLYNYIGALNSCPCGWHLPDDEEWNALAQYISDKKGPYDKMFNSWTKIGAHLKANTGWRQLWENFGNGTDDFGFTGLPGNGISRNGNFDYVDNKNGYWWSYSDNTNNYPSYWNLSSDDDYFENLNTHSDCGFYVRCLKNDSNVVEQNPVVETIKVEDISTNSALLEGLIISDGGSKIISKGFYWDHSNPNPNKNNNIILVDNFEDEFKFLLTELDSGMTYYFTAWVENCVGTTVGESKSFSTLKLPEVVTSPAGEITDSSAVLGGEVLNEGNTEVIERGIQYSANRNIFPEEFKIPVGKGIGIFKTKISDFQPVTEYFFRTYAQNSIGITYGDISSFTTNQSYSMPSVTTWAAIKITQNSAKSGGSVSFDGNSDITEFGIVYSQFPTPSVEDNKIIAENDINNFFVELTGLEPDTTYYVRAYAINAQGVGYGNIMSFKTNALPSLAAVRTNQPSQVLAHTAILEGQIENNGNSSITERGFVFDTVPNPTVDKHKISVGGENNYFQKAIAELIPNKLYYFKAYVKNSVGISYGEQQTFTTQIPGRQFGTFIDFRDNYEYKWIEIGDQIWMAQNLAYFPSWGGYGLTEPRYRVPGSTSVDNISYVKNFSNYYKKYGVLYNYPAAVTSCPNGWHLPEDKEWKKLEGFLGMDQQQVNLTGFRGTIEGNMLKDSVLWNGNNYTGFSALPGGYISGLVHVKEGAYWWSSTHAGYSDYLWIRHLDNSSKIEKTDRQNIHFLSIRCIRDEEATPEVKTTDFKFLTDTSVVISGEVIFDGNNVILDRGFCWSKLNPSPDISGNSISLGGTDGIFDAKINTLVPGTRYYFRAYAKNKTGITYGDIISFNTYSKIEDGKFYDKRDGKQYSWIKIGQQYWMAENLAYLPVVSSPQTRSRDEKHYYVYDYEGTDVTEAKSTENYKKFGVLYNWAAATDACPEGWHLPDDDEWKQLESEIGLSLNQLDGIGFRSLLGYKLKTPYGWNNGINGTNEYGFSALPGGSYNYYYQEFLRIESNGSWWSYEDTLSDPWSKPWYRLLKNDKEGIGRDKYDKGNGISVRCIKD